MDDSYREGVPLGPFRLDARIGQGGMGEVWRGLHCATELPVAVKLITASDALDGRAQAAFSNEVRSMARLDHPRVVQIYDFDRVDAAAAAGSSGRLVEGSSYLVMELLDAGILDPFRYVRPWDDLKAVLLALLSALSHAHARGLIHRDLKPGNILFAGSDTPLPGLRLTDFGIAQALGSADEEEVDWGTPHYMSPEQHLGGSRDFGPWTDLYALGCIAWELATGNRPFPAETVYEAVWGHLNGALPELEPRVELPAGFYDWVARLLAKKPRDRFAAAADAAFVLQSLDEGRVWGLPPLPFDWRPSVQVEKHPLGYVGAGLGLFSLRSLPLMGRDQELDRVWAALREVWSRAAPQVVALHGPAGYGKSRLVRWISQRAEELGCASSMRVSHDLQDPVDRGLRGALREELGCGGLVGAALRERLGAVLREEGVESVLLEVERHAHYLEAIEDQPGDLQLIVELLRRKSMERPLILWLDEPHRSAASMDLLAWLLGPSAGAAGPVLTVVSFRDDSRRHDAEALARLRRILDSAAERAVTIPVAPLSASVSRRLAHEVLGLDGELADRVLQAANGSPMFVVQLARCWVQQGLLEPSPGGFVLRAGSAPEIPEGLHGVWMERVRSLCRGVAADALAGLEAAAVLGLNVDGLEWNHLCSLLGLEVTPAIWAALLKGGLVRATERGWEFSHERLLHSLEENARVEGRLLALHRDSLRMLRLRYPNGGALIEQRCLRHQQQLRLIESSEQLLAGSCGATSEH